MADGGSTSGDVLLRALEELIESDFKRFKDKLSDIDFKGQRNIPRGSLEGKDRIDTKNLLVEFYGKDSAIDVTIEAFTRVSLMEAAARLREERPRVLQPKLSSSIQGETTDFRGINMEHIFEKSRLIDRNARVGETVPLQKKYTKHLIVQQHPNEKERQHEIMSYGWKHTEIMDRLVHSKLYFHLDSLFDSMKGGHRPRTVVLQGPAGIGKTMTAQKIMLDWTLGKLYRELFDYVFYLSCREINRVRSDNSVFDVISASCPERTVPRRVLLADPSKILLILDGFDELKFSLDLKEDQLCRDPHQRNPVEVTLSNLLRRNILPGCTLIITTRPTALERLRQCIKADLCAEIIGFTEEDRKSYFSSFFGNDEQASRALALVKDNDTLYTMCFLPIVCSIVCTVMKQQMERGQDITNSSKTTTEVYLSFLSTLLSDHSGASSETKQRSLKKLCSLALNGIFEQKILFYEEELKQFGLEVSDIQSLFLNQTIFHRDIDVYSAYSFIHLSFQEFFAALFYILDIDEGSPNPKRDLKHLLKEYSQQTKGHFMLTVRFLFGLINKEQLHHVEKILGCKISLSARADLVAWLQEPKEESLLMDVFHCLHEAQDEEMISTTMNNIQSIQIKKSNYSIVNLKAISFGLMHCQGDKTLNLRHVHFGPKAQEIMSPGVINCSTLRLQQCYMWDKQSSSEPWSSKEKREADISVLCAVLRDPRCRVRELSLSWCGITGASCAALVTALRSSRSLLTLDLSDKKLGDSEVSLICDSLKHPDTRLQKIRLKGITGASCAALAAFLCSNHSLLELDLRDNYLGDAGATLLCDALKHPDTRLQKINLSLCWITGASCAALAAALRTNHSLLDLDLRNNHLGDAGASLICDSLMHTDTRLQKICLRGCWITAASCAALATALRSNSSLLELDLGHNKLGDAGVSLICDALKHPDTRLQKISLQLCEITGASSAALATALRSNRSLLELGLSRNVLGDAGLLLICDALKEPDSRLQKIKLSKSSISSSVIDELKGARPELEIVEDDF
ncbi:NACHT, LRR and PYD domains-containing protein 3-like [Lissotriton helveticus]